MRTSRPTTPTEQAVMQHSVDKVYDTFTAHVAAGRNLSRQRTEEIAQGQVYSGTDATKIGLADICGGIKEAIIIAAQRAGTADNFQVTELTPHANELSALFAYISSAVATHPYAKLSGELQRLNAHSGVVALLPVRVKM